jgi:dolichol-phosphate mannosyltransferase
MDWQFFTDDEVPARWFERAMARVAEWLSAYLRWYLYAFPTTYLWQPARSSMRLKTPAREA